MRVLLGSLVLLLLAAPLAGAQVEPDDAPYRGPLEYTVDVYLGEDGANLVIYPHDILLPPNARVTFHVMNVGATEHDLSLLGSGFEAADEDTRPREDGGEAIKTPLLAPGEEYDLVVFFPPEFTGSVVFICSVPGHRGGGMEGQLSVGAAAGGEEKAIEDYGVNYLAYWVGIISFVLVFLVLFATFFLFRYGESKHITDHRTGVAKAAAEGGAHAKPFFLPEPDRVAIFLALVALLGVVIYFFV